MFEVRKLFLLVTAGVLCVASAGQAANLITDGDFSVNPSPQGNGPVQTWLHGHVSSISYNATDANDHTIDSWSATGGFKSLSGEGGGVAIQSRDATNWALPSNGHLFYQYVPVTAGRAYYVHALWKGNLNPGVNGAGRGWAEVYVGFAAIPAGSEPNVNTNFVSWPGALRFRKMWDVVSFNYQNISPTGAWPWEDISASPSGLPPAYYVPQAGQNYMVVAFLLGGDILTGTAPIMPSIYVDNVSVIECSQWLAGDVNQDCAIGFADLALLHSMWLECNLDPISACP